MKRTAFLLALLATTALYPSRAAAMPPVIAAIGAFASGVGVGLTTGAIAGAGIGGAFAAGLTVGGSLAGFAATALGGALINAAIGIGLNYLVQALTPRPQASNPGQKLVNLRQTIPDRAKSYGYVRTGGPVAFWKAKDAKRYVSVMLNSGPIARIVQHWLDERVVTLDGSGFVTDANYVSGGRSRVQIEPHTGGSGQVASPILLANFAPDWTSAHVGAGIAHTVCVFENTKSEDFSKAYPSGREPTYSATFAGTPCYDPRTETVVETQNAALIIADWITSPDGLNREVDWDQVADEADIADQTVTTRDGTTIPRWTLSGTYAFSAERESVRAEMGTACDAFFYEAADGTVGFTLGRYTAPTVTIGAQHILSMQLVEGSDGPSTTNAQAVQFTDPALGYRENECSPIVVDDDQPYEQATVALWWINNHNQASRIAKRLLRQARAQFTLSASLKLQGLRLRGERFFRLDVEELGLEDVVFEIGKLSLSEDGQSLDVEARSVTADDFAFNAASEEGAPNATGSITDASTGVAVPTGITAVAEAVAVAGGAGVRIRVDWDDPTDTTLNQVRWRAAGGDWFQTVVPQGQGYQITPQLSDGVTYDIQVRAQRQNGAVSDWAPATPISVAAIADTVSTGPVTGVSATGGTGTVTINWTAPNAANYQAVRIYRGTTSVYASATLVAAEYGAPNAADSWTQTGVASGVWYYFVVAVNASGLAATAVSTGAVTVS